jgi:hypothetical protein
MSLEGEERIHLGPRSSTLPQYARSTREKLVVASSNLLGTPTTSPQGKCSVTLWAVVFLVHWRGEMRILIALALCATPAQAFQLSCTSQGGMSTMTQLPNGKEETKRLDYTYASTVDVDLRTKKLSFESIATGDITEVTDAMITAVDQSPYYSQMGMTHTSTWQLNRVTGELTWYEQTSSRTFIHNSTSYHKCELAKPKF